MKDLLIVGAGGFGREVLQWIKDINKINPTWRVLGFLDDDVDALNGIECDYGVVDTISHYQPNEDVSLVMAVANPNTKEKIVKLLKNRGAHFVSIIHPTATLSEFATIGEGLVMYPYSIISVNTTVGDFVTFLSSGMGHDAIIGDFSTISSFCDITGGVTIGKKVFLGSHVTIVPKRKIGDEAYIAAGSVVMTNIRAGQHVMGNPAMKMDY